MVRCWVISPTSPNCTRRFYQKLRGGSLLPTTIDGCSTTDLFFGFSTRAGREALAEYRLGPARLMRAQSMTSRKVSACLRDYSHRAPRRTRSSLNDLKLFQAQVAHAEAEADRPEPHAGRGVIVTAKRIAIDRSLQ